MTSTLTRQCRLFAVGSGFFALATVPGFSSSVGAGAANALCFVGSWFFTSAAWTQLTRSGPEGSVEWLSAAVQFVGTVLFNVSTGAAVLAHAVVTERRLVWAPDASGSLAFLISAVLGVVAVSVGVGRWAPSSRDWQAGWINVIGCVAFGVTANLGTFVGAWCFLVAALLILPRRG